MWKWDLTTVIKPTEPCARVPVCPEGREETYLETYAKWVWIQRDVSKLGGCSREALSLAPSWRPIFQKPPVTCQNVFSIGWFSGTSRAEPCFFPSWFDIILFLQTRPPGRSGIDCDDIWLNLVDVHRVQNGQRHLPPARSENIRLLAIPAIPSRKHPIQAVAEVSKIGNL